MPAPRYIWQSYRRDIARSWLHPDATDKHQLMVRRPMRSRSISAPSQHVLLEDVIADENRGRTRWSAPGQWQVAILIKLCRR